MSSEARQLETILVIDGDPIERTVISDYLRECGYRVIEANDALEARQILEHRAHPIEIILSDVELPGETSGFELAGWVRRSMPEVEVILSSALERTAKAAGDLCEEGPMLAKPYDPQIVVDHIRRLRGR
jgi:CheY-like chemotaxis protein